MSQRYPLDDWIALNLLPGLGPVLARRALERFGDPGAIAHRVPPQQLRAVRGFGPRMLAEWPEARRGLRRSVERELRLCRRSGARALAWDDPDYPAALRTLSDPPVLVYLRGELPEAVLRVAVVGSRRPTGYGRRVAVGLAGGLAERGIEVVSGGAVGIDTLAHRGALEVEGRSVAVLGSGLLEAYPMENRELFARLAGQGAVLSEFPLRSPAHADHFPRRNRLISGLSAAVVVVEAAERSGSLITAGQALEQGREVLAVPGPVTSPRSAGCNRLIQQGAKLVQQIDDILEELPPLYLGGIPDRRTIDASSEQEANLRDLDADERAVLGLLDKIEPVQLEELADRAPFGIARLQTAIFGLELRGAVEQCPGKYYLLRPRKDPLPRGT